MQQGAEQIAEKDGASQPTGPVSLPEQPRVAKNAAQASVRAKMRALAEAMGGPCIVRTVDGAAHLLTVEGLKFIPFHEVQN